MTKIAVKFDGVDSTLSLGSEVLLLKERPEGTEVQ